MVDHTATINLANQDEFVERVAEKVKERDESTTWVDVTGQVDPWDDQFIELAEHLKELGEVESGNVTELDIRIRYDPPSVVVTHVKEVDD